MTLERLEKYYIIARQIEAIEKEYVPSYISGVDTTKSSVQSGKISDITCDTALQQLDISPAIKNEYARLKAELAQLNSFIFSIDDELTKAMIFDRCCLGYSFKRIGSIYNYSAKQCKRKIRKYVQNVH